jgi:hypothetical protein
LIACGSASRSKAARTRRITSGSTPCSDSLTRSSSWQCGSSNSADSQPSQRRPPASSAKVRTSRCPTTASMPTMARVRKNPSIAGTSYGGR